MKVQAANSEGRRVFSHPVVLAWLTTVLLIPPMAEWFDALVLFLCFAILPIFALGIWLLGVPTWMLCAAAVRIYRRQWSQAFGYFAILPVGLAVAYAGLKCGDALAVLSYGPRLEREVDAVNKGDAPKRTGGVFSSSMMAFELTGGFLDVSSGIVYDASGRAGEMLPLPPSSRPPDWQANAVDVLSCRGGARHLYGKFYAVTVSSYSCE